MHLKRCDIENFRSIRQLSVGFENRFQILVGLNEAGKSNILRALAFLDRGTLPVDDDVRDPRHDEPPVSNAFVRFVFGLEQDETRRVFKALQPLFKCKNTNSPIIKMGSKDYSLEDFCEYKKEGLFSVDLLKKTKSAKHWSLYGSHYTISKAWKVIPPKWSGYTNTDFTFKYICVDDYPEYKDDTTLTDLTVDVLNTAVGQEVVNIISKELFECIVWRYSESNLLPARIELESFTDDPEMCEPLKNIFFMSGFTDVPKAIQDANAKKNGMRNLLRKLSDNATRHLRKVWPEYKNISIVISQNGSVLETGIEDEFNVYSLERRSDGFKRFITFLLMISVKAKAEYLYDTLIIVDEPDIGLHPSGIQYLRDELKKIAADNIVVIATHSIFMIDKDRIDRHLIVKKEKEETVVLSDYTSNMLDEEVIYRALGYSLFDIIKKRNVMFEGWSDKHVFQVWLDSTIPDKDTKRQWKDIGLIHALGAKDVCRVALNLENMNREYLVITDSDDPSTERQRAFRGLYQWVTYKDLGFSDKETIEDFIDTHYITNQIMAVLKREYSEKGISIDACVTFNSMLKHIVDSLGLKKEEASRLKKLIKNEIHDEIPAKHIHLKDLISAIKIDSDVRFQQNTSNAIDTE